MIVHGKKKNIERKKRSKTFIKNERSWVIRDNLEPTMYQQKRCLLINYIYICMIITEL